MKSSSSYHSRSYHSHRKSRFGFLKTLFKIVLISVLLVITVIILTPTPHFKDGFKNLKELQTYANQTNEQTPMENDDTLKPEFTKYYQSQIPTFFQKIKNKIKLLLYLAGIKEKPVWSVSFFKTILENTLKARETAGYKDNLIYKIQTDPNAKFVIFGNMQGAFHSLVRCLNKIKELGIIGDDLKVTNPNNYIIFMGDLVDRSPFTLEILTAALKLMEVNPQNVIYMRGNHEAKDYWQEHTLKTELQIRAAHLSKEAIPLQKEVSSFFNTLPLAIYLTTHKSENESENEFVRISEFARSENDILNESSYADFLTKRQASNLSHFVIKQASESANEPKSDTTINIKVTIHNEKKRKTFQKSEGLRLLSPDMDSVSWTLLSCPTIVYQKALGFYNDAFVVLSATDNLENWEITLYSRDVRTKDPFRETKFNFLSGLDIDTHKIKMATAKVTKPQIQQPQQAQVTVPVQQVVQPQAQLPQVQVAQPQVVATAPQVIVPTQQQQTQTAPQVIVQQPQQSQQLPLVAQPQTIVPAQQVAVAPQVIVQTQQQQTQAAQPPQVIVPTQQAAAAPQVIVQPPQQSQKPAQPTQ